MNDTSTMRVYRLLSTFDVDAVLANELERLRLEIFRNEQNVRMYRLRLWRSTVVRTVVGEPDDPESTEIGEWETLEDFADLFEATDLEFEVDSPAEAEQRALGALKARIGEAAWAKG